MKICIAQSSSEKGDFDRNIESHLSLIQISVSEKAEIIVFPELSLTGYHPSLARELAISGNDSKLDILQEISNLHKITICVGVPTKYKTDIFISMIIFSPNDPRRVYSKQMLHADELPFFSKGAQQILITKGATKIAPAICYESLQPAHSMAAFGLGANIYMASIAKSQIGLENAMIHFPKVAGEYSKPVLMTNCVGPCENFIGAGKSAIWNAKGMLLAQLDEINEGLLLYKDGEISILKM